MDILVRPGFDGLESPSYGNAQFRAAASIAVVCLAGNIGVVQEKAHCLCQTVPLDIYRTPHHRRNDQTAGDLEGKLGKIPTK